MTKEYINELLTHEAKFRYMLLSRLEQDCRYYLGYGNRSRNSLWAGDEAKHIEAMKMLYNSFADSDKPEWITMDDIKLFETEMLK